MSKQNPMERDDKLSATIRHLVLIKWKSDARDESIRDVLNDMRAFAGVVPGVQTAVAGKDTSGRAQGFTHAFLAMLKDEAALRELVPHPAHQAMRAKLQDIMDDLLVFDFVDMELATGEAQ